eukprot:350082-Chlamydomonas_euryale.AAC.1
MDTVGRSRKEGGCDAGSRLRSASLRQNAKCKLKCKSFFAATDLDVPFDPPTAVRNGRHCHAATPPHLHTCPRRSSFASASSPNRSLTPRCRCNGRA